MRTPSLAAASLALLLTAPVAAQTDEASPQAEETAAAGPNVEVVGVEYAFQDLPTSVPAGTTLTFSNDGIEAHELALARIADDVTETFEELMGMEAEGRDPLAEGLVEIVGPGPLIALPGMTAEGSVALDREGRYIAICFFPQGLEPARLAEFGVDVSELGPDTDESTLPAEAQAFLAELQGNPPHAALGMVQEFTVTAADSTPGPLPEVEAAEPTAEVSPDPEG